MSDCIQDMRKEYEASCGLPITDDSQSLLRFCSKLEHLLQIGLRGKLPNYIVLCIAAVYYMCLFFFRLAVQLPDNYRKNSNIIRIFV